MCPEAILNFHGADCDDFNPVETRGENADSLIEARKNG
jgi:hypothetical protein